MKDREKSEIYNESKVQFVFADLSSVFSSVSPSGSSPKLISDGLILECDAKLKIWGWTSPGEKISVQFINTTYQTAPSPNDE